jgi:hypothetical protein
MVDKMDVRFSVRTKKQPKKIGCEDLLENGFGYAQICFALMFTLDGRNIKEIFVR